MQQCIKVLGFTSSGTTVFIIEKIINSIPCHASQVQSFGWVRPKRNCKPKCNTFHAIHIQKCKCSPTPGEPLCQDLDALFRYYLYGFIQKCASSSNFLSDPFEGLMLLINLRFPPPFYAPV